MKAKDILKIKGPEVVTISEKRTVSEAIESLVKNNIGVLLVLNEEAKLSGIISERDIIRAIHHDSSNYGEKTVGEVMTKRILYADYEDSIEYLESIMTNNRIRHIPIMHDNILAGLISIGDVVKYMLKEKDAENKYLLDFLSGNVK